MCCPPATIIDAVILFKDRVITTSDNPKKRKYNLMIQFNIATSQYNGINTIINYAWPLWLNEI